MKGPRLKTYPHFDAPLSKTQAVRLASNPDLVARNPFYPFLQWDQRWTKFARKAEAPREKRRPISYAARRDSFIFGHYRELLHPLYEGELERLGLTDCVLAYRRIQVPNTTAGKCNIHFAGQVFRIVRELGDCWVLALDIRNFFENLDHDQIKRNWSRLLGRRGEKAAKPLPADHFHVFSAVTRYSWVGRDCAYKALGFIGETETADGKKRIKYLVTRKDFPPQICPPGDFRRTLSTFIDVNRNPFGIPQGSPISDLLANLYMIDFDKEMSAAISSRGGRYFRYSDDILIVLPCAATTWQETLDFTDSALARTAPRLEIKKEKTQVYVYGRIPGSTDQRATCITSAGGADGLEYLGFRYDGKKIFLRNSTVSGFRRKIAGVSERMARNHAAFNQALSSNELMVSFNFNVLFKKFGRIQEFDFAGSEYTKWTFWTYVLRAVRILGPLSSPILRQIGSYKSFARKCVGSAIQDARNQMRHPSGAS
jgi:hypothetical protein